MKAEEDRANDNAARRIASNYLKNRTRALAQKGVNLGGRVGRAAERKSRRLHFGFRRRRRLYK